MWFRSNAANSPSPRRGCSGGEKRDNTRILKLSRETQRDRQTNHHCNGRNKYTRTHITCMHAHTYKHRHEAAVSNARRPFCQIRNHCCHLAPIYPSGGRRSENMGWKREYTPPPPYKYVAFLSLATHTHTRAREHFA